MLVLVLVGFCPVAMAASGRGVGSSNVYAATISGQLSPAVAGIPERVYVPNSTDASVDVIDPSTFAVTDHYQVGTNPYHIAPSWDLTKLYVDNEGENSLTVIDPHGGKPEGTITVTNPYNLYFTPDGKMAVVIVERQGRIEFRDSHDWHLIKPLGMPVAGIDHLDFSADGSYALASTEWTGYVLKIDMNTMEVAGMLNVGGQPVDVRLSPDGSVFYVANQVRNGVSVIDTTSMKEVAFISTDRGAHGLILSRDTAQLYVANRGAGTISVINIASGGVAATWITGGSPDMMVLSPDGRQLWATGRNEDTVYVVDTSTGQLMHRITTHGSPHGLCYFPNPGRYSVGHNGVYR